MHRYSQTLPLLALHFPRVYRDYNQTDLHCAFEVNEFERTCEWPTNDGSFHLSTAIAMHSTLWPISIQYHHRCTPKTLLYNCAVQSVGALVNTFGRIIA